MYGYIYVTTNLINKHMYIGQHKYNINKIDESYLGSGTLFLKALKKYGKENFKVEMLGIAHTKKELNQLEKYFIATFIDKYGKGMLYNMAEGGQGGNNSPMTPERKANISKARKGQKLDPKRAQMLQNMRTGRIVSEESKLKARLSNLGQARSEEARKNMSLNHADVNGIKNPFFGKKHTPETLKKISESAKGRNSNKNWINNGIKNTLIDLSKNPLPDGWKIGRLPISPRGKSSTTIEN